MAITAKFENYLEKLINAHGVDAELGVPDFILAEYVVNNLRLLGRLLADTKTFNDNSRLVAAERKERASEGENA